jgi:hypothetical protein
MLPGGGFGVVLAGRIASTERKLTGSERMMDAGFVAAHYMLHGLVCGKIHGVSRSFNRLLSERGHVVLKGGRRRL